MSNTLSSKFNAIEGELNLSLFERREMIHGLTLSILSDTNMLLLGSPGTGKSMLVTEWSKHITDAKYFAWMLSKFSTPEELFGPFSINALENDRYLRVTAGKLPDAHFGFIDEIFKAGAAILNSMLTVLNERIFYNDGVPVKTPLISIIGASNEIPEEDDGLDFNSFVFDYEEYQRLQFTVDWVPELYEYKIEGKKQIWKYSNIDNIINRKTRTYSDNLRDFGKYFLGEIIPFILNYRRNEGKYFFHIDTGFGNFVMTVSGYCLLEPNNWKWITEDKFDRIVRYTTQKFVK